MSAEWNGLALQNEFANEQSDTSTDHKARALQFINDVQREICALCNLDFMMKEGRKTFTVGSKIQSLFHSVPSASVSAISAGGTLTAGSYIAKITFYESVSGLESLPGIASNTVTATLANATINLTSIPKSLDTLVTSRKVYLSKDGGDYYYHSTISDNTSTSVSISSDSSSVVEPPEYSQIRSTVGDITIVNYGKIDYRSQSQIRELFQSYDESGTPNFWATMGGDSVLVYPSPSSAIVAVFFYQRTPARIYASVDSIPELPISFKELLRAGVMYRGYMYSDRDGKIERKNIYDAMMQEYKSKMSYNARGVFRIRDVKGRSDGREI